MSVYSAKNVLLKKLGLYREPKREPRVIEIPREFTIEIAGMYDAWNIAERSGGGTSERMAMWRRIGEIIPETLEIDSVWRIREYRIGFAVVEILD